MNMNITTACIEWSGRKNANGYGTIRINGKQQFAHRLAVALSGRNIPKSKVCDHLCRNHSCINPEHIELVSLAVNNLRGQSPPAKFARSNKCSFGHLFDKKNTRIYTDKFGRKTRHCRHCYANRELARERRNGVPPGKRRKYE